jgi:hypothetical protein
VSNPINHVRLQRPLAVLFIVLVLAGLVAAVVGSLHAAATPPPPTRHHTAPQPQEGRR